MAVTLTNKFNASYLGFYANDYIPYFSVGIVTYYAWRRLEYIAPKKILVIFSLFLIGLYISAQAGLPYIYPFAPSALVLGALLSHSAGKRIEHPLPLLLGATSYALYLIHTIILEMLRTLQYEIPVFRYNSNIVASIFAVLVCTLASIAVHLSLEKPIVKSLRIKCTPILERP
jgi:peptidoglycan/LPS O-acetylase OafA/YrhL